MTMTRTAVESLASLCGAIPGIAFTVTTTAGAVLDVAERPEASLCPHAFRRAIAAWPASVDRAPCVETVCFEQFHEQAGVLARLGERWLVSPLDAAATAEVLHQRANRDDRCDAMVREDPDFGGCVVRLWGSDCTEAELDEAAIDVLGTCLTEHLCGSLANEAA